MTDYVTPGRNPHTAGVRTGVGDSGSAGRRVVRSALELLAETASPEILRGQTSSPSAVAPAKFTITYATAPAVSFDVTDPKQQLRQFPSAGKGNSAMTPVTTEEPSTLLFLSPAPVTGGSDSAVKKRLFKKKKKNIKLSDSVKKASVAAAAREMWDPEASACQNVSNNDEHENKASGGERVVLGPGTNGLRDQGMLLSKNEPLFTEEEVQERILVALKAYEARRDAEEESVLQEVGREIESQNERYDKLLKDKQASAEECDVLQAKMEQLAMQCEALQNTIAELHQELQEARNRASRAEVELCHAQDEKRLTSSELQQELNFEKAQWKLAQEEMQRQIAEFETQLQSRTFEWHELQETSHAKENEQVRLSQQLEACQTELEQWQQRHSESQAAVAELQELIGAKEALIRQLHVKLQEAEKAVKRAATSTRDEQTQIESRLQSVEEALQQQTDEVRRKVHRVHVLEMELAKAEKVGKTRHCAIHEATNRFSAMHSTLEELVEMFRTSRPMRSCSRGLREALFPTSEWGDPHPGAAEGRFARENDTFCGSKWEEAAEEGEGEEDVENSIFELVMCRELRDDLRQGRYFSAKTTAPIQQRKTNTERPRGSMPSKALKKNTNEDADEADECGRLRRCHRLCERLLETLRRLHLQRREQMQRQFQQIEARQVEKSKAEITRCQNALAACQASVEESKHQERLMREECRQRSDEVKRLEAALVEMRAGGQEMKEEQKRLMERMGELQRERGILNLQLEASQQDCVELRERYESARAEAEELRERVRLLENSQRSQEEVMEAKAKALARMARCTEKLKKTEGECQALRDENEVLSNKVKSMLLQLQTSRMQQRSKGSAASVRQQNQQQQQQEELTALTKEMGALRKLQESAAAMHAKERAEAEVSLNKLAVQKEELRDELVQQRRALADALSEVELQKQAEAATLRTLMSIHQAGGEVFNDTCVDGNSPHGVQQRLFDASPILHTEDNVSTNRGELTILDLRGRVVSLAQRAVLELARLREAVPQRTRTGAGDRLESFQAAEQFAWEAAQRSAARRQLCTEDNGVAVSSAPPPTQRVGPVLRSISQQKRQQQKQKVQCHSLGTPGRCSLVHRSPSPKQVDRDVIPIGFSPKRHSVSFTAVDAVSRTTRGEQKFSRHCASSSSLASTGGVSRSRSVPGVLDGNSSPARPPMLRAPSVR
ncbi:hypothetical protein TraAM80_03550 [Trypanosoma rangeli]|uniref:Uncharacterized protein n=1 Tax=Trypanosoma rangeli TaxID=5698 RepID=A0A3R7MJY3_TRYRA|nr:uncharacterized protein TraAM80_03550 [Trypanosoma rangeli]RNF07179.1 hypothetical protein TraAM80_03550 [Trypanosoma rangeli]|eukprot:RNF07179.1 hypothetical protein TraAM80_03550 [Trypanosoma rangeli]